MRGRDGYLPLALYGVLGDGRSVALSGADGSIDWWCVPQLDAAPLFNRLMDADTGGFFSVVPRGEFTVERRYRRHSNVLETVFTVGSSSARLTESLNSGLAGRLPWSELARRIEGLSGSLHFDVVFRPSDQGRTVTSWREENANGAMFHVGNLSVLVRHHDEFDVISDTDREFRAELVTAEGTCATIALLADVDRPLVNADMQDIDRRIDRSDQEWRDWAGWLTYTGAYKEGVIRSALAMKLLLYSPTGAIAAAATSSLPERIGGEKNYDYRFAWVRDVAYTIKSFLSVGALCEVQAAFAWVLETIRRHGSEILPFYQLDGELPDGQRVIAVAGYRGSGEVHRSNAAREQFQLGLYGDLLETAWSFVRYGHQLDTATRTLLSEMVDRCADAWLRQDAGIWELAEQQHYTSSKINCWVALSRAVEMAEGGHLERTHAGRWRRERDRIGDWIDEHCWNESKQAYTMYAGSEKLDASVLLGIRFGFHRLDRLRSTLEAVVRELSHGSLVYRYSGMEHEEGAFIACAFWVAEAYALLDGQEEAVRRMTELQALLDTNLGILNEMVDPRSGEMLGNMPQCLSHLAMIDAAISIDKMSA